LELQYNPPPKPLSAELPLSVQSVIDTEAVDWE
jgi:hypothetical protein